MYSRLIRSTLASAHTVSRVASAGSHAQCVAKRVPGVNAVASVARFSTTGQRKEEAAAPEAVEKKLPDLPSPVTGYPTPWLTKEEVTHYIKPLNALEWYAEALMYRVGPTPESERPLNLKIASLSKRYVFNTPQDADTFLKEGLEICAQEKHDPVSFGRRNLQGNILMFRFQTHTATPGSAWAAEGDSNTQTIPGLTLRDIRIAYLFHQHFEKYLADGRGLLEPKPDHIEGDERLETPVHDMSKHIWTEGLFKKSGGRKAAELKKAAKEARMHFD